jgi:hypothetical protein
MAMSSGGSSRRITLSPDAEGGGMIFMRLNHQLLIKT